ncbi:D-alanyl-D-alanine carboxypeptidase/D-alanyl-D-alanine-endopeptidase [soil metagenome]
MSGPFGTLLRAMRRLLLPMILALLTIGSGLAAIEADAPAAREGRTPGPEPHLTTPVLSARRVPELLADPVGDRRLNQAMADLVARSPAGTCLSVQVNGEDRYAHQADLALVPASAEKLVTALAALEVLGSETRFRTSVTAFAPPTGGIVEGDLWLVGTGDPLLATDDYVGRFSRQPQVHTDLEALADAIAATGVREVRGRLIGDESRFDATRYVPSWPPRYIDQDQTGPLSALTVNDGFVQFPRGQGAGGPVEPAPDPPNHAAGVLAFLLGQRGVSVLGGPASGQGPPETVEVAGVDSPPVRDIVGQMLTESDNMTAELLLKQIAVVRGVRGSTAAGAAEATRVLAAQGLPLAGVQVVDGSGLDEGNRLTCTLLQELLELAGPDSMLAAGLPVAGRTGTLAERFVGTAAEERLRAKTGTLHSVTSLAGFVESNSGRQLSFSYVVNAESIGDDVVSLQTELGDRLARYPEVPPLDELGPRPAG